MRYRPEPSVSAKPACCRFGNSDSCALCSPDRRAIGVLLANVGTPAAPTAPALRAYLRQFLSDTRIAEQPPWKWLPILYLFVLTTRPQRVAKLYAKIWTDEGSPLLAISRRQAAGVAARLEQATAAAEAGQRAGAPGERSPGEGSQGERSQGEHRQGERSQGEHRQGEHRPCEPSPRFHVAVGMRYGQPSIESALADLRRRGAERILFLPLFPQYAAATTASALDVLHREARSWRRVPEVRTITSYHADPGYIRALAASIRETWEEGEPQKLLLSYHGVPQRYVDQGDPYQCQCLETTRLLVEELGIDGDSVLSTFQSQFGREQWILPKTDQTLRELAREGVGHVDVACPGFSADCIETLEEIDVENRGYFEESGGERLRYIPCLNDRPDHLDALTDLILRNTREWRRG